MDKLYESLKRLLPEDTVKEVSAAVQDILKESINEIDSSKEEEFNYRLKEAYAELSNEKEESERVALEGYAQAYAIINDLRNRIEMVKEEYEQEMNKGFTEAYEMIKAEKGKNNNISSDLYEEYDSKLDSMKKFFVDKIHEFLYVKGNEIYEQAKRDILNDPRMAEHKVAMDRVVDVVSRYVSDEDKIYATSNKLEESYKKMEDLQAQIKLMEGRNFRLSHENTKLNEQVRHTATLINENRRIERKVRKKDNVTGRGHKVYEDVIITEHNNPLRVQEENALVESLNIDKRTLNLLAGTKKDN